VGRDQAQAGDVKMRRLLIRSEAEAEIEEAYHWYEGQRDGLGSDFLLCLEEGLEKLRKNPGLHTDGTPAALHSRR
jgi:hypothetical protein